MDVLAAATASGWLIAAVLPGIAHLRVGYGATNWFWKEITLLHPFVIFLVCFGCCIIPVGLITWIAPNYAKWIKVYLLCLVISVVGWAVQQYFHVAAPLVK